jgi:L-glyceraldehyde 3-phosphate reductase
MSFNDNRYQTMQYRRCGDSGLMLPAISLGCWHNFGDVDDFDTARDMLVRAFDLGITHFDLANNYGPSPGSAERNVGKILRDNFADYRDELIISSKAGYRMWPGPYGEWGSRKYLIASCNASLQRLGLDYVDIFYHHRPDPDTPLAESIGALDTLVRHGKALYVGISSYGPEMTVEAASIARDLGTPLVIHQPSYSMLNRNIEKQLIDDCERTGLGIIAFCPLAQGVLTNKYLQGIPEDSRAASEHGFLKPAAVTEEKIDKVKKLSAIAEQRNQSMAQLALAWTLRDPRITSALIGASRVEQIEQNVAALANLEFTEAELAKIDDILG